MSLSSGGDTFVSFRFSFFLLSLKPRPFVQSFFDMHAPRQPHIFLPFFRFLCFFEDVALSEYFCTIITRVVYRCAAPIQYISAAERSEAAEPKTAPRLVRGLAGGAAKKITPFGFISLQNRATILTTE